MNLQWHILSTESPEFILAFVMQHCYGLNGKYLKQPHAVDAYYQLLSLFGRAVKPVLGGAWLTEVG